MGTFDKIHRMLREERLEDAFRELLDDATGEVRSPYDEDMNNACYLIGDIYFRCGQYTEALGAFQDSLAYDNDDYRAIWAIAGSYSEMGNHEFAEREYRRALSFGMRTDELAYNIGCELFDQGKYAEAVKCFSEVATADDELREKIRKNMELAKSKLRL